MNKKTAIRAKLGMSTTESNQDNLQDVLDYIVELEKQVEESEDECLKLQCLEEMGVDNWSSYDEAMELYKNYKNEENE